MAEEEKILWMERDAFELKKDKVVLLEALIADELRNVSGNLEYWGQGVSLPEDPAWGRAKSMTLYDFLNVCPEPKDKQNITLFGIAWEFVWGEKPPESITNERERLLVRARYGLSVSETEKIWLKLIAADVEYF